jgi:hypothetical protein
MEAGMHDITKTRMLLTTAVFAAVAALFACGANAMLSADGGSGGTAPQFTSGHQLDAAIGTAMATRAAETAGQATSSGNDTDWTWVGFGAGMAALLAAALTGLYFSARHRGRVVLP